MEASPQASPDDAGRAIAPDDVARPPAPDGSLHVETRGEGGESLAPLVLVHGVLDSARSFSRLARKLDTSRQVVAYDRRGYQRSRGAEPASVDLRQHVDDLISVLEELDAPAQGSHARRGAASERPAAVLLGHSYGGIVALAAAARRPDLVGGVLAYEPPLSWLSWWPEPPSERGTPAHFAERFMRTMIGDRRYERLSPTSRDGLALDGPAAVSELRDLAAAAPFDPSAVGVPVVVARGARTSARHVRAAEWLAAELPCAKLEVVGGADHGAHISHPGELARLLEGLAVRVEARASRRGRAQDG
ncbi:MAG: alpha/beta hydrolase fold protein [Acidimicrobiaceae bacterium]|jgi:pimeloyl-ACP methyl ester carboxylesterase|nr:alpha/beta hydrolase fold protein [Acidimicrobiaceae bacterium]